MTITIYANWKDQEILTDRDRDEWIEECFETYCEKQDVLDNFLSDLISTQRNPLAYLLKLREDEKQEILEKFKEHCKEIAIDDFDDEHEEFEIGI